MEEDTQRCHPETQRKWPPPWPLSEWNEGCACWGPTLEFTPRWVLDIPWSRANLYWKHSVNEWDGKAKVNPGAIANRIMTRKTNKQPSLSRGFQNAACFDYESTSLCPHTLLSNQFFHSYFHDGRSRQASLHSPLYDSQFGSCQVNSSENIQGTKYCTCRPCTSAKTA
jgi:hypothetical protein